MKIYTKSLTRSTIGTIWLIVIVTIWGELSTPFKTFLANITGHHWVTKGVFSLVFFVLLYLLSSTASKDAMDIMKETYYILVSVILGGLIIFLFYVWHFFS